MGQAVSSANKSDSCFCYMMNNETQTQAQASCALHGGYLADVRNVDENNLLQKLVYIVQTKAPQVSQA